VHADLLPAAIRAAFNIAGVFPVFLHGLSREAWLSTSVKSEGQTLLIIDDGVSLDRLEAIADEVLAAVADRARVG